MIARLRHTPKEGDYDVLRIHFTAKDLAGLRVNASWGPLSEALFSLAVLEEARPNPLVDGWRQGLAKRMRHDAERLLPVVRPFAHVDLHTLVGPTTSLDEGLDALRGVAVGHLDAELGYLRPQLQRAPSWKRTWLRGLQEGDPAARRQLVSGLRVYGRRAIEPYWDGMLSHLEVDRAVRGRIMTEGGVDKLLSTLHPMMRWQAPVLEIARPPGMEGTADVDVHLAGRSLVLVPSVFLRFPQLYICTADETRPEVLFYPALRSLDEASAVWSAEATSGRPALDALLGRTRALALEAAAGPCTTNELARRIGVSASTASHHASVLREAGLISTQRNGGAVLHSLTLRGALLLEGVAGPGTIDPPGRALPA